MPLPETFVETVIAFESARRSARSPLAELNAVPFSRDRRKAVARPLQGARQLAIHVR